MSGFLSKHPDLKGVSYEYADGSLGLIQAYQAAKKPLNLVLTLRTDEMGLFCAAKKINNPNFKIFYSNGGNFQSHLALTLGMIKLNGGAVPGNLIVPASMRRATNATCKPSIPGQTAASTLVPDNVLAAMY
jgi:ABC-type sugar transport system substrate-binding protein